MKNVGLWLVYIVGAIAMLVIFFVAAASLPIMMLYASGKGIIQMGKKRTMISIDKKQYE